jgi:hypothetical protein
MTTVFRKARLWGQTSAPRESTCAHVWSRSTIAPSAIKPVTATSYLIVRRTADCPTISSQSLARTRGQRQQHARDTTPTPMLPLPTPSSQTLSSPYSQDALPSSPPYSDHDRPDMNMANPDVRSIPWKRNSGLTVNIALFVLHMLAGLSRDVRDGYPDIHEDPEYFTKLRQPSQ